MAYENEKLNGLCKQFKIDCRIDFSKKEVLMHYISKSCDLLEQEWEQF